MHKVKHALILVVFLLVTVGMGVSVWWSISGEKEADYVVETNVPFAPFEFYENRQIVGVDVDIVNRVAEKMNKTIQIKNVEFDVIIDNVEAGRIADAGAAGLTITPVREAKVNFTIPYYDSVQYVIYSQDLFIEDEIENGVLKGTSTKLKGIDSHQLAADAILAHIIDYAVADELAAKMIVEKNPGLAALPLYYAGKTREEDYPVKEAYAIAVNKDRGDLLTAFNEVLGEMLTEGEDGKTEIDRLVLKYMGFSNE